MKKHMKLNAKTIYQLLLTDNTTQLNIQSTSSISYRLYSQIVYSNYTQFVGFNIHVFCKSTVNNNTFINNWFHKIVSSFVRNLFDNKQSITLCTLNRF